MKGLLIVSHGSLAKGTVDTARYIMGKSIEQFDYCCLDEELTLDTFSKMVRGKIRELDSGEGVIILADFYGGSTSRVILPYLADNCELITGFNFPLLMEILMTRIYSDVDVDEIIRKGQHGIKNARNEIRKDYLSEE